jgi:hypothetical protein
MVRSGSGQPGTGKLVVFDAGMGMSAWVCCVAGKEPNEPKQGHYEVDGQAWGKTNVLA